MQNNISGTAGNDVIKGTSGDDAVSALAGNDHVTLGAGNDVATGGRGSDTILGGSGNDNLHGDSPGEAVFKTDLVTMAEDYTIKATFDFEEAGYRNTLGVYKVDPVTGNFTDVKIMWENASLAGSGGNLIGGKSSFEYPVEAGDKVGFFLIGNGFSSNNFAKLGAGSFKFVDAAGKPATVNSTGSQLVHVSTSGKVTALSGPVYHTAAFGDRTKLNSDGIEHTMGYKKNDDGSFQIGFEDLWKGGDRDFDDAVFTVDVGKASVQVLNQHYQTTLAPATAGTVVSNWSYMPVNGAEDRLEGGLGADTLSGNQGNDLLAGGGAGKEWKLVNGKWVFDPKAVVKGAGFTPDGSDDSLVGGEGDDVLLGGSGNDALSGGIGADTLNAGSGDDRAFGEAGNDVLNLEDGDDYGEGGDGNDVVNAGAGDDLAYGNAGNDSLRGGDGDDALLGGDGVDDLQGGDGNDRLDGDAGNDKLFGGLGEDTLDGGDGDDYVEGGDGNDQLSGGAGNDRLIAGKGEDKLFGGEGADTLVGGAGGDTVSGGAGDDQLWGGNWSADGAKDVFVHAPGGGRDVVQDFEVKHDQIDLSAYGLSYEDLAGRIVDKGWATEINLAGLNGAATGDALVIKAVKPGDLNEDHFIL
ncbi:MAG: hypothetical protein RLZZ528_1462 [Pseudomonadota bacterium]